MKSKRTKLRHCRNDKSKYTKKLLCSKTVRESTVISQLVVSTYRHLYCLATLTIRSLHGYVTFLAQTYIVRLIWFRLRSIIDQRKSKVVTLLEFQTQYLYLIPFSIPLKDNGNTNNNIKNKTTFNLSEAGQYYRLR